MTRLFCSILIPIVLCACCKNEPHASVMPQVAEETLQVADESSFDYLATLRRAMDGDEAAAHDLFLFADRVDAASALGHGVVLVDLATAVGDKQFAKWIRRESPDRCRQTLRLLEAGFDYHRKFDVSDFGRVLPITHEVSRSR
jgi:hypothetical protein